MSPANQILGLLVRFRPWWMVPTLICTLLAIIYVLFAPKSYSSRQTLVVRDNLVGTFYKPGRFESIDSMKSAQETILEISRRPQVIRSALKKLGPPAGVTESNWPSDETIEDLQGKIRISAPNGAEFGKTEAIVLTVESSSRQRSKEFIAVLLDEIEASLRDFRSKQFASMQKELAEAAVVAKESYEQSATELRKIEAWAGPDLSTLISMNDSQAGTNSLQSELATLTVEQRTAWTDVETVKKQIHILRDVNRNPEALLQVPTELLQLQPTLDSLASGLNTALLKYSTSIGKYQSQHHQVREDLRALEDVKQRINEKLAGTLVSLQDQLDLRQAEYDQKTMLINQKRQRLSELSEKRVTYLTLLGEVEKKTEVNGNAQANLSEIQSLGTAANEVDLITRIDEPQVDLDPIGPSNKMIVLGGIITGLFIGFGLVMFVAPVDLNLVLSPTGTQTSLDLAGTSVVPRDIETDRGPQSNNWKSNVLNPMSQETGLDAREVDSSASTSRNAPGYAYAYSERAVSPDDSLATKIRQLEQAELYGNSCEPSPSQPITFNVPGESAVTNTAGCTSVAPAGLSLKTSNQNSSSAAAHGDESDPNSGTEPEIRPTASTVDLRKLKNQLSGKAFGERQPDNRNHPDGWAVQDQSKAESSAQERLVVDQHIADLANSIRDMCKPSSEGTSETREE